MRHAIASVAAACALLATAACGPKEERHAPLHVAARSGAFVDLSWTAWQACRPEVGSPDVSVLVREEHGPEGGIVYTLARHEGTDCTGALLGATSIGTYASAEGERAVAFTGTPPAGLGSSVVATKVSVDGGAYGIGRDCYWVDDTVTPRVLYTGDPNAATDAQGFPDAFLQGGEVEVPRVR